MPLSLQGTRLAIKKNFKPNNINAIANNIEKLMLNQLKIKIWNQEGKNSNWRLIDYSDIVVHIFKTETRKYYNLEELWEDGETAFFLLLKKILMPFRYLLD